MFKNIFKKLFTKKESPYCKLLKMTDEELKKEYSRLHDKTIMMDNTSSDNISMHFMELEFKKRNIHVQYGVNLTYYKY